MILKRFIAILLLFALVNAAFDCPIELPSKLNPPRGQFTQPVDDIDCLAEWLVERVLPLPDHTADDECNVDVDNEFRVAKRRVAKVFALLPPVWLVAHPAQLVTKMLTKHFLATLENFPHRVCYGLLHLCHLF